MAERDPNDLAWLRSLALVSQLGLAFAAPVVAGAWLGSLIDSRLGGGGLGVAAGVLTGVAAGALAAYRMIVQAMK